MIWIMWGAVQVWGKRVCGKSLYLTLHFIVNLKLLYKKSLQKIVRYTEITFTYSDIPVLYCYTAIYFS